MLSGEITLRVIHIEYERKIIQEKINNTFKRLRSIYYLLLDIHIIEDWFEYLGRKATVFKYLISLYQICIIYYLPTYRMIGRILGQYGGGGPILGKGILVCVGVFFT